jgi:hypothetical protein
MSQTDDVIEWDKMLTLLELKRGCQYPEMFLGHTKRRIEKEVEVSQMTFGGRKRCQIIK